MRLPRAPRALPVRALPVRALPVRALPALPVALGLVLLTACGPTPAALAPAASGAVPSGVTRPGDAGPAGGPSPTTAPPTGTADGAAPVRVPVTGPPTGDTSSGGTSSGGTSSGGAAGSTTTPTTTPTTTSAAPRPDDGAAAPVVDATGPGGSDVGEPVLHAITCDQTEAQVAASGAPRVTRGDATVYIGAQQVGGDDQAPRVVRFDGGERTWCRDDLERSGDDGRGYGLLWSGEVLLAVFSATGNQGDASADLRRFTGSGWLRSYADASPRGGGGPKVAVLVELDADTGAGIPGRGTWITADNGGKVNSATVTDLALDGDGVRVTVSSAFAPRGADRSAAECSGSSPFTATYTFDRTLGSVTAATLDPRCT